MQSEEISLKPACGLVCARGLDHTKCLQLHKATGSRRQHNSLCFEIVPYLRLPLLVIGVWLRLNAGHLQAMKQLLHEKETTDSKGWAHTQQQIQTAKLQRTRLTREVEDLKSTILQADVVASHGEGLSTIPAQNSLHLSCPLRQWQAGAEPSHCVPC